MIALIRIFCLNLLVWPLRLCKCIRLRIHKTMNRKLLDILVCPVTKGRLKYDKEKQELISRSARLAYPIIDGKPIMIESDARVLTQEEVENL